MRYEFKCVEHGPFIVEAPMKDGPGERSCPTCDEPAQRIYESSPDIWYTDGAHKTDYFKYGNKQDYLAKEYEAQTGEKAPEPAKDAPRNYKVKA